MLFTFGEGLIVIVKVFAVPTHELAVGVTVMVPTTVLALSKVVYAPIFPVPVVPNPTLEEAPQA
jgi:hypothetical protein